LRRAGVDAQQKKDIAESGTGISTKPQLASLQKKWDMLKKHIPF